MMTTKESFEAWYELHGNGHSYHAQLLVWQHQQARIDELENEVEKLILLNDKADGKADELENKLVIAVEALTRLRDCDWVISLPDRMDAVRDIAREALKLIEVSE